jgi:uncharacterized membrane-anchored protein YjiN (DUF445 family)
VSSSPLHLQSFEPVAARPGIGQAVRTRVGTDSQGLSSVLRDRLKSAGTRLGTMLRSDEARDASVAREARERAIQRLANDPNFIAGL